MKRQTRAGERKVDKGQRAGVGRRGQGTGDRALRDDTKDKGGWTEEEKSGYCTVKAGQDEDHKKNLRIPLTNFF